MTTENNPTRNISPAIVEKVLNLQEKELILRGDELELKKQNEANSHSYAKIALEFNKEDRAAERKHQSEVIKYKLIGFIVAFFLSIVFLITALVLNKEQVVIEIIKAAIFLFTGGAGGYALAKSNSKENSEKDQ